MKKRNFRTFSAVVDGKTYGFTCWTTDTRTGFCHTVRSDDYAVTDTKVSYFNRTWERFDYETALGRAIDKFPKPMREALRRQLIDGEAAEEEKKAEALFSGFKALHDGLNDENKKRLAESGITIQDEGGARAVMGLMALMTLTQR